MYICEQTQKQQIMKKKFLYSFIGLACLCQLVVAQTAPEKKTAPKPKPAAAHPATKEDPKAQEEAGMKAWMTYMTPGAMHEILARLNGDWNEEVTMWMAPGAEPQKSTSKCTNSMIMGGRYQESKHFGNMGGMPFEGISTVGYDNQKKVFVSTWIDNMGTGISYTEGKWNDATKSITFTGKMVDPMLGKEVAIREVFKIVDDTHHEMEMYETKNGKEFKTMEIKFSR